MTDYAVHSASHSAELCLSVCKRVAIAYNYKVHFCWTLPVALLWTVIKLGPEGSFTLSAMSASVVKFGAYANLPRTRPQT